VTAALAMVEDAVEQTRVAKKFNYNAERVSKIYLEKLG
jgi:hypothetical protein